MATIHAVPIAHRKYAEAVPESLRATLSGAELAARCAELERLDRHAAVSGVEVEVTRALASQAKRVATALPICQFIERKREIGHRINGSGSFEVRGAYHALNRQLVEQNKYASGLESACDQALLNRPSTPEAEAIVRHHRG